MTREVAKFDQGGGEKDSVHRSESPTLCTFYNADFIIYSSMGSFYMPCVAMLLLYWKIFRVINDRVRRDRLLDAPPSSSGTDATITPQPSTITWRRGIAGRRAFIRTVFDRLIDNNLSLHYMKLKAVRKSM